MRITTKSIIAVAAGSIRAAFETIAVDGNNEERQLPRDAGMLSPCDLEDCRAHLQVALASIDQALKLEK